MASRIMDILSWKNKQDTGVIFLSLNLTFYLIVLGNISLISVLTSILMVMIAVINIHSFINKTSAHDDEYLYVSKETLSEIFVFVYEIVSTFCNKIHRSFQDSLEVVFGLLVISWLSDLFGTFTLLWIVILIVFTLTPQYLSNKDIVDQQIKDILEKIGEAKKTVFDIIPKYKGNN